VALYLNSAGLAQLFQMMRNGSRADQLMLVQRATSRTIIGCNLPENCEAAGISQRTADCMELLYR
jgi:hypothetical protein